MQEKKWESVRETPQPYWLSQILVATFEKKVSKSPLFLATSHFRTLTKTLMVK